MSTKRPISDPTTGQGFFTNVIYSIISQLSGLNTTSTSTSTATTTSTSADTSPPADIPASNISLSSANATSSINLNVVVPTDNVGTTSFKVAYSTSALTSNATCGAATSTTITNSTAAGSTATITITGLNSFTSYYFCISGVDSAGNVSANWGIMSTQPSTAPRYVAVGQNVNYWVSGDGINWNYKNNMGTTGPQLNGLVFGNNTWVAVGGSGGANCVIYYSSDAITWTQASCPTNIALKAVAFGSTGGSNYFAATGDDGSTNIYTFYSSNGSSWSNAAYSPQTSASSAAGAVYDSGNNAFVFTSNLTTSVYSTSFANLPTSINPQTNSGISGGGFLIQSVAGTIVAYGTAASNPQTNISTNSGSTWAGTVTVSGCGTSVNGLAFGSSTYVATCSSGSCGVSSSSDATTWSGVANSGGSCSGLTWAYATFSSTDSRFVIVDNSANPNFSSSSSGTTGSFSAPVSVTSGNQVKAIATRP